MLLTMGVVARNNIKTVGVEGAPLLLLAHGFGCDQNLWRPIVERLRSDFRIVLMDHVGAGGADPAAWD
ncbi:MAG: alpha/beta hydrolase, partial [Mycolicibacterium frederiksbergense]|nr:alpha/beta hydrolase [Mycolicibacterium frederiksbergense]